MGSLVTIRPHLGNDLSPYYHLQVDPRNNNTAWAIFHSTHTDTSEGVPGGFH